MHQTYLADHPGPFPRGLCALRGTPASDSEAEQEQEQEAILAGIFAGEIALEHSRQSGVLKLFVRHRQLPRAEPRLEALRSYAELRRVFLDHDRELPVASLSSAGFTDAQIVNFDAIIVAWPEG